MSSEEAQLEQAEREEWRAIMALIRRMMPEIVDAVLREIARAEEDVAVNGAAPMGVPGVPHR